MTVKPPCSESLSAGSARPFQPGGRGREVVGEVTEQGEGGSASELCPGHVRSRE